MGEADARHSGCFRGRFMRAFMAQIAGAGDYMEKLSNSPALFDWSIIGCTILRLALMNLKQEQNRDCQRLSAAATNANRHRK